MSGSSINNNASIAFFSSHSFSHYVKWLESENLLVPGILAFRNSKPPHTYVRANLYIFPIVQSSLFNLVAGKANSTSLSSMDSLSIYMPIYTILMLSTGYLSLSSRSAWWDSGRRRRETENSRETTTAELRCCVWKNVKWKWHDVKINS